MSNQRIRVALLVFIVSNPAALVAAGQDPPKTPGGAATTQPASAIHPGIPPRPAGTDRHLIDLTSFYTLALGEDASGVYGFTLDVLPKGVQQVGDVAYDLRGIVQTSCRQFQFAKKTFPETVKGIPVGLKCRKLNFLHASRWTEAEGTTIGSYVIHYANGERREVPIVFGLDLRDWRPGYDPGAGGHGPAPVWRKQDNAGQEVALFQTSWPNPLPDVKIQSIDLVSNMTNAGPFLVGVTAQ